MPATAPLIARLAASRGPAERLKRTVFSEAADSTAIERIVGIDINPTYVAAAQECFGTQLPLALYAADIQEMEN
ncbi:MAG TPA: hypothetical protein VGJ20_18270 [Xanthobacteraceae bacterium]|jgi:hypothetical protein